MISNGANCFMKCISKYGTASVYELWDMQTGKLLISLCDCIFTEHCILLYYNALNCSAVQCSALHCTALHCTALLFTLGACCISQLHCSYCTGLPVIRGCSQIMSAKNRGSRPIQNLKQINP